ncbi:hypothetical protein Ate02nite_25330 [Paractinoplanes tereljensis]|uniref:Uncharacterized protein n=1 Tax=Paractinoplanes tereljensis TaxID=571912 RepID=A0A919TR30_9ACTN|nr:hypothetical protein Ate02nite_25330 [Actinoplanes tereljensis]
MALEEMGHDPVALGDSFEVVADVGRVYLGDRTTSDPHSIGTNLVEAGGARGGPGRHVFIVPYRD